MVNAGRHLRKSTVPFRTEQLENERKDRSRWATARLKLLAEFCDEENKLSSALRFTTAFGGKMSDEDGDEHGELDDGDEEDDRRRGSIVFG